MRKIILYIAQTLDGYIARKDGSIDFLDKYGQNQEDYGYHRFMDRIDTMIMGMKTYQQVSSFEGGYPHHDVKSYILTHQELAPVDNIIFTRDVLSLYKTITSNKGKDVFLVGGAKVIQSFMNLDLIDEMIISILPETIGEGIPLFIDHLNKNKYKLISTKSFTDGIVQITYKKYQ